MKWLVIMLLCGVALGQQSAENKVCNDEVAYIHPRLADMSELSTDKLNWLAADLSVCTQLAELPPMTLRDLAQSEHMIGFELGLRASKAVKVAKGTNPSSARRMFAAILQGAAQAAQAQANNPPLRTHCNVSTIGTNQTIDCY